jgi:hypothetical protein
MTNSLEDEIQRIVAGMESEEQNSQEQESPGATEQEPEPIDTIHIHYFPDAILIVKEEQEAQVVDSTPVLPQNISLIPAYAICCFYILLIVSTLAFQVYCIVNPPIATVTIIPKAEHVTMTGTLQLGRLLPPLTISQSQTVPTTGKGHQSAKSATGYITFYNGQFQSVTIPAGTILTGTSGIQVVTNQDTTIPAGNPPSYGQVSVSAHAISPGVRGNIPAYDISLACCATSVLAKNTQPFTGGQDERNFQTVAKSDIDTTATPLKTAVAQSLAGAFQGQLQPAEQQQLLPCTPSVTSDHQPKQEATQVKVTVSETCSAIAYNKGELETKVAAFLATQALQKVGAGYSLFGTLRVSVTQATVTNNSNVFLSFHAQGTWVYALGNAQQQYMKRLIAGKTKQQAVQLLASLPGVERAAIGFSGFGDDTRVSKDSAYIHLVLIFTA